MSKSDGGPAFPQTDTAYGTYFNGMSLRDYFIAHAPAQEIDDMVPSTVEGCANYIGIALEEYNGSVHYVQVLAKARAKWADAMLRERERGGNG